MAVRWNPADPFGERSGPELVDELATLLRAEGESQLAVNVRGPSGRPLRLRQRYLPRHQNRESTLKATLRRRPSVRALLPSTGILILDIVDEQIMYIEILDRPPMHCQAAPR